MFARAAKKYILPVITAEWILDRVTPKPQEYFLRILMKSRRILMGFFVSMSGIVYVARLTRI